MLSTTLFNVLDSSGRNSLPRKGGKEERSPRSKLRSASVVSDTMAAPARLSHGGRTQASSRTKHVVLYGDAVQMSKCGSEQTLPWVVHPKRDSVRALLSTALKNSFFFESLEDNEIRDIISAMEPRSFAPGELLSDCGPRPANPALAGQSAIGPSFFAGPSLLGVHSIGDTNNCMHDHSQESKARADADVELPALYCHSPERPRSTRGRVVEPLASSANAGLDPPFETTGPLMGRYLIVGEGAVIVRQSLGLQAARRHHAARGAERAGPAVQTTGVTSGSQDDKMQHHGEDCGF